MNRFPSRHGPCRLVAALALLLLAVRAVPAAEPLRVVLVIDQEQAVYRQLVTALERELRGGTNAPLSLEVLDLSTRPESATNAGFPSADLYIAAGTDAAARMAQANIDRAPLLSVLVPRLSFEKIFGNGARAAGRSRTHSAIFLDQPFERQLDLLRLVLPDSTHVGVALGPGTNGYADELARASSARGLRLHTRMLSPDDNLVRELDRLLPETDVLLGIVDPLVFNRANAHKILLTAYRHRVPLIGVSPAYVRAGALAAVYSTPEQIGRELGELLVQWSNGRAVELPAPRYPRYFSVTVNRQVAASLGLAPPTDEQLARRLGAAS